MTLEEAITEAKTLNAMMGHKPGDPHGWTVAMPVAGGILIQFYPEREKTPEPEK